MYPVLFMLLALASSGQAALTYDYCAKSAAECRINAGLYSDQGMVFRGTVVRDVSHAVSQGGDARAYIVQVERVIKGCSLKKADRVLVASHGDPELCGIHLAMNSNYVFTSNISQPIDPPTRAQLGNRSKAKQLIWVDSCGFNQAWDNMSPSEKAVIESLDAEKCSTTSRRR